MEIRPSNKKIAKEDCVVSKKYVGNYKGRKIEFGVSLKEKLLVIFVDDIWLSNTAIADLFPFEKHETKKLNELTKRLTEGLEVTKHIIDCATEK
jgi:hypothetical protein